MIAKSDWFNRRKFSGWGLTPKTWQGWLYILLIVGAFSVIQRVNVNEFTKIVLTSVWAIFILFDFLHVMFSIDMDEREQKIEAIAERNASWTMVVSIALAFFYVITIGKELQGQALAPVLLSPIATGLIAKAITYVVLTRRGI